MEEINIINIKNISKGLLKTHKISPSVQRLEILSYLLQYKSHPSVDEIYGQLIDSIPTLSKTTVYNTLNLFLKEGIVQTLNINTKEDRFDATVKKHAHFLCSKCGKIEDIENDKISDVLKITSINKNHVDFSAINFVGICKNCQQ